MNQKHLAILFIIIAAIGLGIAGFSKLSESNTEKPTPTPAVINPLFTDSQNNQKGQPENTAANVNASKNQDPSSAQKSIKQYPAFPALLKPDQLKNKKAVIETSKGKIEFEIYPEATSAASNFIFLAKDNFYNNLTFHRVVPGFVIQGGDPLGNGAGGPGYKFKDEPVTRQYTKGIVAMANAGPDTNGSQFFIMLTDHPELPPKYTIFGQVISGQDVVDKIAVGDVMAKVSIETLK